VAPVTYSAIVRARQTRAASARLRAESASLRRSSRTKRQTLYLVQSELARRRVERDRLADAVGTWPYWGPPTPDLLNVLVLVPEAA